MDPITLAILVSAGASLGGSALSGSGAGKAADAQAQAAIESARLTTEASERNTERILEAAKQASSLQELQQILSYQMAEPYYETGTGALLTLADLLKPGGYLAEAAPQFRFDVSRVAEEPGYQFALNEGLKALQRSAAARGSLLTGGTQKALERYATDYATTKIGDVYKRELATYQTNLGTEEQNRQNLYNRLAALAGIGQQAGNEMAAMGQASAANIASTLTGSAQQAANLGMTGTMSAQDLINQAAAARASGYASGGNIWGQAVTNLGNMPLQYLWLKDILAKQKPPTSP